MSTGAEMQIKIAEAQRLFEPMASAMDEFQRETARGLFWLLESRPCHAQRARKLRRRGMNVRFDGFTSTGRSRYRWAKPLPTIRIAA